MIQFERDQGKTESWLAYWSDVLRFSDFDAFAQTEQQRSQWFERQITLEDIASGKIPINPKHNTQTENLTFVEPTNQSNKDVALVMLPFGYEFRSHGKLKQRVVIAVPATLNIKTGELGPSNNSLLINTRHLASPEREKPRIPRVGLLSAEAGETNNIQPSWQAHWTAQNEVFKSYQDHDPRSIDAFSWTSGKKSNKLMCLGVATYNETPPANRRLIELIEDIQTQTNHPPLLKRFIAGNNSEEQESPLIDWQTTNLNTAREHHKGHMGRDFGLDITQRLALWQTTTPSEGNVVAVSGPPGTGKTSMLQGFIASQVVNAVFQKRPAVILAASQTNQATQNMIQAFGDIATAGKEGEPSTIEHRWIQGCPSYGWFFPSATKRKDSATSAFQTLYRENWLEPELWAEGKAHDIDGKARPVSSVDKQSQAIYRNQFMTHYRSYLNSINEPLNETPTTWLKARISKLVWGPSSALQNALVHCDEVELIIARHRTWDALDKAECRKIRLERKLPRDKSYTIERLTIKQAQVKARIEDLKKAYVSAKAAQIKESDSKPASRMHKFISLFYSIAPPLDPFVALAKALLDAKVTIELPDSNSLLLGNVPEVLKELMATLNDMDRQIDQLQRWQRRRDLVIQYRANQLSKLQSTLNDYRKFSMALGSLRKLFVSYRDKDCAQAFTRGLNFAEHQEEENKYQSVFMLGRALGEELSKERGKDKRTTNLRQILECVIDLTVRYHAFHLSMRYWESRWLDEVHTPLPLDPKDKLRVSLERATMLAPVIVVTVQTMPSMALYRNANNTPTHLLEVGDWLIIDEAGQVAPHLSIPLTALARNALVVGDVHQLAPVVDIDQQTNQDLRRRNDLDDEADEHSKLALDAVSGNVMLCAQYVSVRHEDAANRRYGVMLKYHYRCQKSIIQFCNKLVYDQISPLVPMIKDHESFVFDPREASPDQALLPPMGFVLVGGQQVKTGDSQSNQAEVKAICEWLTINREALQERFGTVEDAVAIITPYAGQATALRAAIQTLGFNVSSTTGHEDNKAAAPNGPAMVVNTVHSLQGAEKAIVLFSSVNDGSGTPFIDASPSMLNVAVSRAKHAFIAFGHPKVIMQRGVTPSGVLGSYLRDVGHRLYPRDLVVLESAGKVALVEEAFGLMARGTATGGHFRELSFDSNRNQLTWNDTPKAGALLETLKDLVKYGQRHYDRIILATDDDREGEAIAWHVMEIARLNRLEIPNERFKRLRFFSMDPQSLRQGLAHSTNGVDPCRVRAALARAAADMLIYHQIVGSTQEHVGRVSAALLDELDLLEKARQMDNVREVVKVDVNGDTFELMRIHDNSPLSQPLKVSSRQTPGAIPHLNALTTITMAGPLTLLEAPAPATSTAALLERAVNDLKIEPSAAMAALQELYEGGNTTADHSMRDET